jgi:hypothetical protein
MGQRFIVTEQERNRIRMLYEQGQTTNTQFMATGTKFCFYGNCRVDIRVINKTTSQILVSKGFEGKDVTQVYSQVTKAIQDDLTSKNITGVILPTIEQLQDTSPKK